MGIFNRLGSVINSYLNDFGEETAGRLKSNKSIDPDYNAAYEELNDFLNGKKESTYSWKEEKKEETRSSSKEKFPPEELRSDFQYLGLPLDADFETCKAVYKKLLKTHHPDRHAGHEGNYKKATEVTAKINAAYDRIERYYQYEKK